MVYFVRVAAQRPDFRLVLAFVWGDINVDTDGNSDHPASREWTELYARNRDSPGEAFDISPIAADPLVLKVQSELDWLAVAVAYLLAMEADGKVSRSIDGPFEPAKTLQQRLYGFDLVASWKRFRDSPYHQATADNPYPNLRQV